MGINKPASLALVKLDYWGLALQSTLDSWVGWVLSWGNYFSTISECTIRRPLLKVPGIRLSRERRASGPPNRSRDSNTEI